MYNVLFVDDDMFFQANFMNIINWNQHNCQIVKTCSNGKDAIDYLLSNENQIHILITDMSMPKIDGVELIKYVTKNYPEIKSIALSNFDDFQYVKQSMQYGAQDYLLKNNLDSEHITELLNKITQTIHSSFDINSNHLEFIKPKIKRDFMKGIILGEYKEHNITNQVLDNLDIHLNLKKLAMILVKIDNYYLLKKNYQQNNNFQTFQDTILNITQQVIDDQGTGMFIHLKKEYYVLIFNVDDRPSQLYHINRLKNFVQQLKNVYKRFLNITCCFAYYTSDFPIHRLNEQYKQLMRYAEPFFFAQTDTVISEDNTKKSTTSREYVSLDIHDEKNLIHAIHKNDVPMVCEILATIELNIQQNKTPKKEIYIVSMEIVNIVNRYCKENEIPLSRIYHSNKNPYDIMMMHSSLASIFQWLNEIFANLIDTVYHDSKMDAYSPMIQKTLKIIHTKYYNQLSLNVIAKELCISSVYLSRIFKSETKVGFSKYVTNYRIEKAKEMILKNDKSVKEIAADTGFKNYNYFFRVFKNIVGTTPQNFYKENT